MFSFYIKKPADIAGTLKAVEEKVKGSGGTFSGDVKSGSFTNAGGEVAGKYFVGDDIRITIVKKPVFYPNGAVESKIRDYFE